MGLLDGFSEFVKTPEGQGLLATVAGGMAGARKGQPWNTAGIAGMSGLHGYSNAVNQNVMLDEHKAIAQIREGQLAKERARQAAVDALPANVRQNIAAGVPYAEIWKRDNPEAKFESYFDNNGREVKGWVTPTGVSQVGGAKASPLHFANTGNAIVGVDSFTGVPISKPMQLSMSPDAVAANKLGWANNALTAAGQNKPQYHEGNWVTPPTKENPTGSVVTVPGIVKPMTEAQGKSAGFADRMYAAEKILSDPTTQEKPGYLESTLGSAPLVGNASANIARSPERQKYVQAQENWVRANLRLESGAAIGKDEMEKEISTYFPQLGDSPEVIAQKNEARVIAAKNVARQGGSSYKAPEESKVRSKQFDVDGTKVLGTLGADGNYYVTQNGKKFRVEE